MTLITITILLGFSILFGVLAVYNYCLLIFKESDKLTDINQVFKSAILFTIGFIIVFCIRDYIIYSNL